MSATESSVKSHINFILGPVIKVTATDIGREYTQAEPGLERVVADALTKYVTEYCEQAAAPKDASPGFLARQLKRRKPAEITPQPAESNIDRIYRDVVGELASFVPEDTARELAARMADKAAHMVNEDMGIEAGKITRPSVLGVVTSRAITYSAGAPGAPYRN